MNKKNKKNRINSSWKNIFINTFLISFLLVLIVLIWVIIVSKDLPSLDELQKFNPEEISKIYSADGKLLKELHLGSPRDVVKISKIPKYIRSALLVMEDRQFYDHSGVAIESIFRAVIVNLLSQSKRQGASTITQQLARNMYNTIGFKKTFTRKLKELITALHIEKVYTKSEIMELYLNSVYFGHRRYGVQSASKYYFGKDVSKLDLSECALLIGMLPAPARYSPKNHPIKATNRRNLVLRVMKEHNYITDTEFELAKSKLIVISPSIDNFGSAPYFTKHVIKELERIDDKLDINYFTDGLIIHTTLDSKVQGLLENSFDVTMEENQKKLNKEMLSNPMKLKRALSYSSINVDSAISIIKNNDIIPRELRKEFLVQGSAVVVDPVNGHILGMVGGRNEVNYRDDFNRATMAERQPGSVFKPMIYLTALEEGYNPTTELLNQPLIVFIDDTTSWNPQNHDGSTGLMTTLREGIKKSLNLISVRVVQELVSPNSIVKNAKKFGLTSNIRPVDAIALGVSEVKLIEMTSAYSAIANDGILTQPISITRIEDRNGQLIKNFYPDSREVKDESVIYLLRDMMKSVVDKGTGSSLRWKYKFNAPAAGKTGTTNSKADAWFVGFTPQLAIGVWVGMDNPAISLGEKQYGSSAALPIFARTIKGVYDLGEYIYLDESIELNSKLDWKPPNGIVRKNICSESYLLANDTCPLSSELYLDKYAPNVFCKKHENPFNRFRKD